jgi:putative methyltransferase (TIGR04325 family)
MIRGVRRADACGNENGRATRRPAEMNVKQLIAYCLPPACTDALVWLRRRASPRPVPEYEHVPDGWVTRDVRVTGWNVESVVRTQLEKWPRFVESARGSGVLGMSHEGADPTANDYAGHNTLMAFAYVLALAGRCRERLSLLDWGGGIGHYCVLSEALLPWVSIDYSCRDLPLLCAGGREVLPAARFYEDDEAAFSQSYDLVLSSSSLQYCEDWRHLLKRMAGVTRGLLYVTRLPVVRRASSFVVVQRPYQYGYQTEYLGWFLNRQELLDQTASLGMELVREFLIQERPVVHGAPEQGEYRGFLFRPAGKATTP